MKEFLNYYFCLIEASDCEWIMRYVTLKKISDVWDSGWPDTKLLPIAKIAHKMKVV